MMIIINNNNAINNTTNNVLNCFSGLNLPSAVIHACASYQARREIIHSVQDFMNDPGKSGGSIPHICKERDSTDAEY